MPDATQPATAAPQATQPAPAVNTQGAAQSNQQFATSVRAVIADLSRHVEYCANNGQRDFMNKFREAAEKLQEAVNKVKV